jgi:hypothetical protein
MARDDREMPGGGGQLALVSYGNLNVQISGNPEETKFYKVYKRYTHFSQESIRFPVEGPNELSMDYPTRIRAKVPRHGDLMTDLTFVFRVPEMYSKVFDSYQPSFRWIHMLGPLMIDSIGIYIGGSKIQEFPGEWLVARATVDYPADKYLKWRTMVGDVPELHTPEWGVYGRSPSYPFAAHEYPHVFADPSGNPTAPSIPEREMRVPLPFWFSESWGRALPLIALQLHEVEVQINLRSLREIYRIMDSETQGEPVRFGRALAIDYPAKPLYMDPTMIPLPTIPDNLTLQDDYYSYDDPHGSLRNYFTDAGQPTPAQDGFDLRAHLEGNFVYLTESEQRMFAERELTHVAHQVQLFRFPSIVTRTKLDLDIHGLAHRIVFYGRRSDAIESRNDYINCSNWKNRCQAPYWPLAGGGGPNSGRLIDFAQRDILRSARLIGAGNDLFEEKPALYFEAQTPFMNATGQGLAGMGAVGLRPEDVMGPIYQIPFALNASDHEQPSGSLNMSRIREIQLEVTPWELDPLSNYVYDFTVFVESINFVKFINGMASVQYAI